MKKSCINRHLLVFLFAFFTSMVFSQMHENHRSPIKFRIVDADTLSSIANARVINLTNNKQTISNAEGQVILLRSHPTDSVQISNLGYKNAYYLAAELLKNDTIYLKERETLVDDLSGGKKNFLYDLLLKGKRTGSKKKRSAKTYFSMEAFIDSTQFEWVEGYFNGVYNGYESYDLKLKNGRIALQPNGLKYFLSLESSNAQYMHHLFEDNYHFPKSPFEMNRKQLRSSYYLSLVNSFLNDNGREMLVVDFKVKKDDPLLFEGRVWLDAKKGHVYKVTLQSINAGIHPYIPEFSDDKLVKADLFFVKTFKEVKGDMYVESIEYTYRLFYEDWKNNGYAVSMSNRLYAYNYNDSFELPYFDYGLNEENEYRKVNTAPYNAFFWEFNDDFTTYDRSEKNVKFIIKDLGDEDANVLGNNDLSNKLFSRSYLDWSPRRLDFSLSRMKFNNDNVKSILLTDKYNIEVQLYLDVNYLNDSLQCISRTFFDPFDSYYYFYVNTKANAFLNMYFDVVEIQRREMDLELKNEARSLQEVKRIYKKRLVTLGRLSVVFFREVDRGNNKEGMMKWNEYIIKNLAIDNWEYFELDFEY